MQVCTKRCNWVSLRGPCCATKPQVWQRVASTSASKGAASRTTNKTDDTDLDVHAQPVFTALKAWRAEVARSHDLPAYVIFNNNTLKALAQLRPSDADELVGVPGIGSKN